MSFKATEVNYQSNSLNTQQNQDIASTQTNIVGPPEGKDADALKKFMEELEAALNEFMTQYQDLYNEYKEGKITKQEFAQDISKAIQPLNTLFQSVGSNDELRELIANFPALGSYAGLSGGFVQDLGGLMQQLMFSGNAAPSPEDLQRAVSSFESSINNWMNTGIYS